MWPAFMSKHGHVSYFGTKVAFHVSLLPASLPFYVCQCNNLYMITNIRFRNLCEASTCIDHTNDNHALPLGNEGIPWQ